MSDDPGSFEYWVEKYPLPKPHDPDNPNWCAVSRPLAQWGTTLVDRLALDPAPGKVGFGKWKLLDRYARLYHRTTDAHRPEKDGGQHHCIHEALLFIWQKLEDVELAAAIPELEPPPPPPIPLQVVAEPVGDPEPTVAEESGIVIGTEEDDNPEEQNDDT